MRFRSLFMAAGIIAATTLALPASAQAAAPGPAQAAVTAPAAQGVTRADILKRADFWFKRGVPYSTQRYYPDPDGKKYRTDAAGYVSMAWRLPTSLTVEQLTDPAVTERITADQLRPGDALADAKSGNVLIFAGWADKKRTHYVAYEQTPPRVKHHKVPYPYWDHKADYAAYRYKNIA
ncbi:hypothetical protein [Kitasatospora sp. NPDC089509]|uniref:hypothetical protein n=1 Tax=Kitasatospora sp. NPDC089509 TaxID=3364079 RepID=UPI003823DC63